MTATTTASKTGSAVDLKSAKLQGNELIKTPIGDIELVHNYFNDDASTRLFDELDYQRAAQSYIWSTPLVSMTTWRDREGKAFGVSHATDFVVLDSLKEKRGHSRGPSVQPFETAILNRLSNVLGMNVVG